MSTRQERLREYANPRSQDSWCGQSSDPRYIKRWSDRAEANSQVPGRARGGEMRLSDASVELHDTAAKPRGDAMQKAKADPDVAGSSPFLRSIRRQA